MFEGISRGIYEGLAAIDRWPLVVEASVLEGMARMRSGLVEAGVHADVAEQFIGRVTEQAICKRVLKSLRPIEVIVCILYQELVDLVRPVGQSLHLAKGQTSVIMVCGLSGSGRTMSCAKLAFLLKEKGLRPAIVAADTEHAGNDQLTKLLEQIGVLVYCEDPTRSPLQICRNGIRCATVDHADVAILDVPGREAVDSELVKELELIDTKVNPDDVLLVCDSATGLDAVATAKAFNKTLEVDGVILTRLDREHGGGAALSIKALTGTPIKYLGFGERPQDLREFDPCKMASEILGGEVAGLLQR